MNWFCSLLLLMYLLVATEGKQTEMEEVEELLELGNTINLRNSKRRLIVLLGSTGTGKSTLAKFVTNDPSLRVVMNGMDSYTFIDNGTISTNIRKSMTMMPNVYKDPLKHEIIVDLPGFLDTRKPKNEIANAYYMKKVLEYPLRLKIVVTENHYSLIEGMDRFGLSRLLQNLAELIPNIERHKGSISLVATKVEHGIEDADLRADLMDFFSGYRDDLALDLNGKSNKTVEGMLRVLNVLVGDGSGKNVAFFRTPTLRSPSAMQKSRESIRTVFFAKKTWSDNKYAVYHYTLSKVSKDFIENTLSPANVNSAVANLQDFFAAVKTTSQSKMQALGSVLEKTHVLMQVQNYLSMTKGSTFKTFQDISELVRSLSAFAPMNSDVSAVTKLGSRQSFFKEFDVDVLQPVIQEVLNELEYMQQWISNVQQQLLLEKQVELQDKTAKEEQIRADIAVKEQQQQDELVRITAKQKLAITQQRTDEEIAAHARISQDATERQLNVHENQLTAQQAAANAVSAAIANLNPQEETVTMLRNTWNRVFCPTLHVCLV